MEPQIVTIVVHSDIDPSELLELANEAAEQLVSSIQGYHNTDAFFHEEETSVEYKSSGIDFVVGGE
jgi:hypothetical protein